MLSPRCTSCPVGALLSFQTEELLNSPSFSVVEQFRLRFFLLLEKLVFLFCVTTQRGLVHTFCFVTTRDVARSRLSSLTEFVFLFASRVTRSRYTSRSHTCTLCSSVTQLRCRHPREDRFETSFLLTVLHTLVEHLLQLQLLFASAPLSLFLHCSKLPKNFCNHPLELLLPFPTVAFTEERLRTVLAVSSEFAHCTTRLQCCSLLDKPQPKPSRYVIRLFASEPARRV